MPANHSNAAALLQKVNSQLRGERVPLKTKEEDELATYLSSLTQKTQQARSLNFEEQGDISISSGADGLRGSHSSQGAHRAASPQSHAKISAAGSKFLKKKKPTAVEDNSDEERKDPFKSSGGGIVIAGNGPDENSSKFFKKGPGKASKQDNKIKSRALRRHTSGDSESEDSLRGSEPLRPSSADISLSRDGPKFLKNRKSVEDDKKSGIRPSSPAVQRSSSVEKKKKSEAGDKTKGEIVRTLGHVYLTSEEESLAEFIHGLSVSEASTRRPQNLVAKKQQKWRKKTPGSQQKVLRSSQSRSPSPFKRSPSPFGKLSRSQSQDSDMMLDSMASEMMEERQLNPNQSGQGSFSSEDHFNINLMDVASLLPSSPRQAGRKKKQDKSQTRSKNKKTFPSFSAKNSAVAFKASSHGDKSAKKKRSHDRSSSLKKVESESNLFENLGVFMVDDLAGVNNRHSGESDSEIKTEPLEERLRNTTGKNDESEIITEIGGGRFHENTTPFKAVVAQSVSELIGSGKYVAESSTDSEPGDTEADNVYSESFLSDSESRTTEQNVSHKHKNKRARHKEQSYSQSTDFHSEASYRGRRQKTKEHTLVVEEKRLNVSARDPGGGMHHWNTSNMDVHISKPLGLQYVDPAHVATHVISADALEAVTAYSPNVLALQDMMRAQLDLVKNFVDIQNRIYQSCLDGLQYDHQYTTLEDTKAYIEQHRKPRMTFKEALKLVEQEEIITRH